MSGDDLPGGTPGSLGARYRWALIIAAVIAGAVLTWLAFGYGVQEKPAPDVTEGVELVQPRDRSAR